MQPKIPVVKEMKIGSSAEASRASLNEILMFSMSRWDPVCGKKSWSQYFQKAIWKNSVGPRSNSAWTSCNERLCKTCKASMKKTDFHAKDCILATWPESQLETQGTQASKCRSACNVCCFYASSKAKASKVSKANDVISHCSKHFLCNTFDPNKSCYGNGRQ